MPLVRLPVAESGKNIDETVENITQVLTKYRRELEFLLRNLDGDNVRAGTIVAKEVMADWVYAGEIAANQIAAGTLGAGVIYAGDIHANQITAGVISAARISTDIAQVNQELTIGTQDDANKKMYMWTDSGHRVIFSAYGGDTPYLQLSANKIGLGDQVYVGHGSDLEDDNNRVATRGWVLAQL